LVNKAVSLRGSVFEKGSQHSIEDLAEYFNQGNEHKNRILPKEKIRYVVYLRKSTDDEAKQVRSIDDQRDECLALAKSLNVNSSMVTVLEESASAKKAGNRPVFNEMIRGFQTGKYHGLLAWSPDRLSRNMKEAGELIDLIDLEVIQELQFKTYQFDNSPNGKMMLGILFATSKQYSDKLAVDVKRGTDGNIKDGSYNRVTKKGYYVDNTINKFVPDSYNWGILRAAVDMRLRENKNNSEIAEFLNDAKLAVRKSEDDEFKVIKVTKSTVGNIFADPFYCGLYEYGDNIVNLTEIYNFVPLITADEYIALNANVSTDFGKSTKVKTSLETKLATERAIIKCKLEEAKQELSTNQLRLVKYSDLHVEDRQSYERYHSGKIEHHEQLISIANESIKNNKNRLKELESVLPTEEQFYKLINLHLLDLLQTDDIMKLDAYAMN
jgi:DNA invertase Pin-like site-specific DNA recombinase